MTTLDAAAARLPIRTVTIKHSFGPARRFAFDPEGAGSLSRGRQPSIRNPSRARPRTGRSWLASHVGRPTTPTRGGSTSRLTLSRGCPSNAQRCIGPDLAAPRRQCVAVGASPRNSNHTTRRAAQRRQAQQCSSSRLWSLTSGLFLGATAGSPSSARGLVHFSACEVALTSPRGPKTCTCPPPPLARRSARTFAFAAQRRLFPPRSGDIALQCSRLAPRDEIITAQRDDYIGRRLSSGLSGRLCQPRTSVLGPRAIARSALPGPFMVGLAPLASSR